jgi:hypothetical protein
METKIYIKQIMQWSLITALLLVMNYRVRAQVNCVELACQANMNVSTDPAQCSAVVNYAVPTVTNDCCVAPTSVPGYTYLGSFGGHTYFMSTIATDWPSANAAAISTGGKLVSINSPAENAFLLSVTAGQYFQIGGFQNHANPNYPEPSGGWEWVDGSPFTYTNWAGGEPNNAGSGEDYMEFYGGDHGFWNDLPVYSEPFAVEFGCDLAPSLISGLPSGSVFPSGSTAVIYKATDAHGNTATCSFNVIVNDNQAPVPNLESLPDAIAQCSASIITIPTANDNCAGTVSGTTSDPLIYNSEGNYIIHWTYNDGHGNSSSQNQTVIVHDITAPVPVVASLPNVTGQCSAAVTAPTANDNCAGVITGITSDPLTYNSEGTYTIHWTYNDGHGNSSSQNQTVIVHDATAPVANVTTLSTVTGQCSAVVSSAPTANDNCTGVITGTTSDPLTYNSEGTYTIHWTYNDGHGNSSSQNQTVIVHDATAPVANVTTLSTVTGQCSAAVTAPTANDNCAGVITGITSDPLTYSAEGTYTIHWTYNDGHGNSSSQNQTVVVHDATAPVANVTTLSTITGQCSATVTTAPKATDNCAGQITGTTSDPLTYSAEGTYTIHWIYNDGHGNSSSQNQTVIVHDATAPVINGCPDNINSCVNVVTWTPPTASDNCSLLSFTSNHNPGETFPNGTTVVTYTANDGHGNTAVCSFNVVVSNSSSFTLTIAASSTTVCQGSAVTLSASGANTYSWNNGVTNGTAFIPSAGITTYTVIGTTAGGCTKSASITITVNAAPAVPGGCDVYKCGTGTVKLTASVGTGETADWYSSATGGTLLASGTLSYTTPNISTTTIYYVQARKTSTGCVSMSRKAMTAFVSQAAPADPGLISGPVYGLCNVSGINYSIAPVARVIYYYWIVPNGVTITAGQGTTQITVNFGSPSSCSDDIYVFAVNACGVTYSSLDISGTTAAPGAISGSENGVCTTSGVNYSITPVFGAVSYTWTVPYGAIIVGANSTTFTTTSTSINVNYGSSFSGSGNICVKTNNACGSSTTSCKQVNAKPDIPSAITGSSSVCAHATVVYQVSPLVAGVTSYSWTVPNGASITAGQGTSQATVHFGTSSGSVSVKAVNGCGYSNYKSKAVSISCREAGEPLTTISSFTAYPNPAHNMLTIKIDSELKGDYQIALTDITGRLVLSENKNAEDGIKTVDIDLSKLPSAVYMLEVKSSVESWNMKVVKE